MIKLSDKRKSYWASSEIVGELNGYFNNNEVIDISGVTMTKDISIMIFNYAKKNGYDKVVGTDIFEDLENRPLKSDYGNINFGEDFRKNLYYIESALRNGGTQIVLSLTNDSRKDTLICIGLLLLMCKYSKSQISLSNTDINSIVSYVRPLVLNVLNEVKCDKYLTTKFGPHYIDSDDGTSVPFWFFGLEDDKSEYASQFIKYFNRLKEIYISLQNEIDKVYPKMYVSDIILERS